ncbi:hypothetical protein DHEL01_v202641 [Diaporthe helianthi]|uniref:Protein kinase domain-containing protein n=1 Tax=Diaporthe helianthi TaxID=158607 RepID=A0A2P5I8Y0_DIAHE|nr:hypothetical protein DHEL01_v202641 [Diaporthe helianthi]
MSFEKGTCVPTTGVGQPHASRKRRRLPTPPSSSSSDNASDCDLQPPNLPYVPGACFEIKPHNPPPPFDDGGWYHKPDPKEWNPNPWPWGEGSPDTIVEQLLAHSPRKTTPHSDQTTHHLQITHQIRCVDPCKAQIVRCLVDGRELVAKIFDPLYAGLNDCGFSPTYLSERCYSCEAAAYMRIKERGLDGRFTPKFEGCWNFELPLQDSKGGQVLREVRLILQQFIPGDTMEALIERGEAENIDPEVRLGILARLTEATSQLAFIGVRTNDNHPRNFMLAKDGDNEWDITLIDFSHSRVRDLPNSKWRPRPGHDTRLPESPITILDGSFPGGSCGGWLPKEYQGRGKKNYERRLRWMKDRWEGSSQYGPVNYDWLSGPYEDDSSDESTNGDSSDPNSGDDGPVKSHLPKTILRKSTLPTTPPLAMMVPAEMTYKA